MIFTIDKNSIVSSKFIQEEYFPVIIRYSDEELNNKFFEFNYKSSDMFELVVNSETAILKQFTLTLSNNFTFVDGTLKMPNFEEGSLSIEGPDSTECSMFETLIYTNGLEIKLSSIPASRYIKTGQIILGLSDSDEVLSVLITDLTAENINHIKTELSL